MGGYSTTESFENKVKPLLLKSDHENYDFTDKIIERFPIKGFLIMSTINDTKDKKICLSMIRPMPFNFRS